MSFNSLAALNVLECRNLIENENAEVKFEKTSTKKVKIDYLIKDV